MSKTSRSLRRALRGLSRAFEAKDHKAFDEAVGELEEMAEDVEGGEEDPRDPDTVEIHNHIPDSRDTALGELPGKDPARTGTGDGEMPPWFKEHKEQTDKQFKAMRDSIAELRGEDRRDRRDGEEDPMEGDESAAENNLEMEDSRHRDEPSEREEMGERIRENERTGGPKDRRDRRNDDEANKEILGELEYEAPPGTGDRARRARDSAYLEDSFQEVVSRAEVIAPGIALPTFDAKSSPVKTMRAIDKLRRTTLDLAYVEPATRGLIDTALSNRTFDSKKMSISNARVLFNVVADRVGSTNNSRATDRRSGGAERQNQGQVAGVQSLAQINTRNQDFWKGKH
jgi:uncharacterized protein